MGGAFLVAKNIFDSEIWRDQIKFRLFIFILGNAAYRSGVKVGNIILKRGQYLRSYRDLRNDLEYEEKNALKKYSVDTIKRKVYELVNEERIGIQATRFGTLFTILN